MKEDELARNGSASPANQSPSSPELSDQQKLLPSWTARPPIIIQSPTSKSPNLSFRSRSRYRAGPARKLRRRAVLKSGECNVLQSRISRRSLRFLQDIFTTLVDTQWRWTLLCFALSFVLSWLVFAGIWYLIAFTHGDFDPRHMADSNWRPCVSELHSFTSCFLFSIETQHTIGYGGRATTEECPEAIFVMCAQSISGVMIQALMVGIVFAKMSRPKQRTQTLLFSKQAVICQRDGELCLMFRVGDMRKSHIIGASVRAQLIRSRTTKEGELLPHNQHELAVGAEGQTENLFFIWPCTVVHRINADSPFYNMSAEDVLTERFEIVVILEGTIESTGQTTQARSSYLPQEVLWGHRFEPLVSYSKERQGYEVDYSKFNSTLQVDTPLCSGRELAEFYRLQDGFRHQPSSGFLLDEELTSPMSSDYQSSIRYQQPVYKNWHLPSPTQLPRQHHHYQQPQFQHYHHQHNPHHHPQQQLQHQQPQQLQHQQPQQQQHQPIARNDEDSKRNFCSECSAQRAFERSTGLKAGQIRAIELDEEEAALLANDSKSPTPKRQARGEGKPLKRGTHFRSCQDLQQPLIGGSSKRYLLLALENSDYAELCSSYPSVASRRHTGSKERLSSLRTQRKRDRTGARDLQEIVVHRLLENRSTSSPGVRAPRESREAQEDQHESQPLLHKFNLADHRTVEAAACCNGSEASCETNSSSETEAGTSVNRNTRQLQSEQQKQQHQQTSYTNV